MTDQEEPHDLRDEEDEAMSALLKRSLGAAGPPAAPRQGLLRGVQQRIRARSRGRFYGDGWSTSSSRINHMLVAAVMLLIVAIAYFALGPMGAAR